MKRAGDLRRRPWLTLTIAALVCASAVGIAVALNAGSSPHSAHLTSRPATGGPKGTAKPSTSTIRTTTTLPVASSWASGGDGLQPAVRPDAVPDQALNNLFEGQLGPGWVGGDSAYSTRLPDGRVTFVFADTLIGTAHADGTATFTGMAHSSELVGDLSNLVADYGGTYSAPQALIPDTYNSGGIWEPLATYTQGDNQMIFVNEYTGPPGILSLSYGGRSGIAVMSVPSQGPPTLSSVTLLPIDPATEWGSAVLASGGYLYVYGAVPDLVHHDVYGMKVARAPAGQSLDINAWEYWSGSQWVAGESNAALVPTVNQLTGVMPDPDGKGFIAVSVPSGVFYDTTVDLSYASSPEGPWTAPQPVYVIPEIRQYAGEMAYYPTFHPEISSGDQLIVSYNIDTTDGYSVLYHDIHSYQPRFLTITG